MDNKLIILEHDVTKSVFTIAKIRIINPESNLKILLVSNYLYLVFLLKSFFYMKLTNHKLWYYNNTIIIIIYHPE